MLFSPKSTSDLKPSHLEPKELFPHFRMQALPQGADETYIWKVKVLAWMRLKKSDFFEVLETSAIISETLPRYRRKAAWQRASACMSTTWVCDLYGNMGCQVSKGGIQKYLTLSGTGQGIFTSLLDQILSVDFFSKNSKLFWR